jgi:hypothetical protein
VLDLSALDVLDRQPLGAWERLTIRVPHRDVRGDHRTARAHVLLPPRLLGGQVATAPMLHVAGYEIGTGLGILLLPWWMEREPVIVNPVTPAGDEAWPGDNALARGPNLDTALLHLARSLPFVDDRRVHITGHSAGGYTSLLLAAETFPLAGVAPDVCPVDIGALADHLIARHETVPRPELVAVIRQAMAVMGDDTTSKRWVEHAPAHHIDEITAPVSKVVSTADTLVPIGFLDPLLGSLDPDAFELHVVPISRDLHEIRVDGPPVPPDGWERIDVPDAPRHWNVIVLDEGPAEPWIDHLRFATLATRNAFFDRTLDDPVGVDQLTTAKLSRLVDRWLGIEWSPGVIHLDEPERERADVLRGLRTFAAVSDAHQARLLELYAALPIERRAFGSIEELAALVR